MGSGKSIHPFRKVKDYDDWLSRTNEFGKWVDQAIHNMRNGMASAIVQPRILMEKTLPQLQAHVKDRAEDTVSWGPVENFPETFSTAEKERLTAAFRTAVTDRVIPAYRAGATLLLYGRCATA